jgi:hypothetical protein
VRPGRSKQRPDDPWNPSEKSTTSFPSRQYRGDKIARHVRDVSYEP